MFKVCLFDEIVMLRREILYLGFIIKVLFWLLNMEVLIICIYFLCFFKVVIFVKMFLLVKDDFLIVIFVLLRGFFMYIVFVVLCLKFV